MAHEPKEERPDPPEPGPVLEYGRHYSVNRNKEGDFNHGCVVSTHRLAIEGEYTQT